MRTLQFNARPGDILIIPPSEEEIQSGQTFEVADDQVEDMITSPHFDVEVVKEETGVSSDPSYPASQFSFPESAESTDTQEVV